MKIGERVSNMCLSIFMVETFGYDSARTNQGTLRRTIASEVKHCLGSLHTGKASARRVLIDRESSPTVDQHLDNLLEASPAHLRPKRRVCISEKGPVVDSQTDHRWGLICEGPIFFHVLTSSITIN